MSSNIVDVCGPSVAEMGATAVVHCAVYSGEPVFTDVVKDKHSGYGGKIIPRSSKPAASTSAFKGVTRHRSTGKFEAHLWDSSHIRVMKVDNLSTLAGLYNWHVLHTLSTPSTAWRH